MTRLLLDTHVFMWWIEPASSLPDPWVKAILSDSNSIFVSAAVAWEIETQKRIGRLVFGHDVESMAEALEFEGLAINIEHAALAVSMIWDHRDPFDRMIVAQSLLEEMTLITADDAMKSAPGVRVL